MGLVHYPVYNKNHERIASAITTIDLHDLARLARTYLVKRYFVITPLEDQQQLAERVIRHWTTGYGAVYNRHRKEAMERVEVVPALEASLNRIHVWEDESPLLITTDAASQPIRPITYEGTRRILQTDERVVFLLFGTAWGLDLSLVSGADYALDPIYGKTDYNHLSVRTAAAIILDRLVGTRPER